MTLYGWDYETWRRVIAWAKADIDATSMIDQNQRPQFIALRQAWLEAGGPMDGPSGMVIIDEATDVTPEIWERWQRSRAEPSRE